jgi:amino acid permease
MINLFKTRTIVALFSPVCISICAVLLLDIKSNIKLDRASVLYYIGLISFFIACYFINKLHTRCNNYESIYMIELIDYLKILNEGKTGTEPEREQIYKKGESKIEKRRCQYWGVIIFVALGLVCVIFSYIYQRDITQKLEKQNIMLQQQVDSLQRQIDSLEVINIEQADESISE